MKKGYQNSKYIQPVQFGMFPTFLTIIIASDQNNQSSFQPVQCSVSRDSLPTQWSNYGRKAIGKIKGQIKSEADWHAVDSPKKKNE